MATGTRNIGEFCWINMLTPQPKEACTFFGALLNWTFVDMPGLGYAVQVGGRNIGGLFDLHGPNTPPGTPAHIGVMVKVESADAISAKVTALGGKANPAFDIMTEGRMAVCTDPNGAQFDVWEPKNMPGTDVDSSLHGAPSWFETMTTNTDRAATFYAGLFGWKPEVVPAPGVHYTTFNMGSRKVAGMLQIAPEWGPIPPHWASFFTVNDADETVRQAAKLGAKMCMDMKAVPGIGKFCGITSPQGVTFYVIQYIS